MLLKRGGGRFFFSSCVFGVGFHFIFGRSLALRGGNLKNQKNWRGVGGEGAAPPPQIHVFNNPLPLPFSTTPRPPLTNPPPPLTTNPPPPLNKPPSPLCSFEGGRESSASQGTLPPPLNNLPPPFEQPPPPHP